MQLFNTTSLEINNILKKASKHNFGERFCLFISAMMLYALSFNLFLMPNNIVAGGITGILVILHKYINIDSGILMLIISLIVIILSLIFLGKKEAIKNVAGSLILPIFITVTEPIAMLVNFNKVSLFVLMIYGGILTGFATGIIIKAGFSQGGLYPIYEICHKIFKISIGKASRIVNIILIGLAMITFGLNNALYGIITLCIASFVTDKVVLGVSDSKTFYIITNKEDEIKETILNHIKSGVTIVDAKGGYSGKNKKVIICIIPTRKYTELKNIILKIDKSAFFIASDAYEVSGGV